MFLTNLKSRSGQALIIILLVMAVSLTLGISVASRSISALRQVSFSAQSAQSLAFAEAGAEEALKCLDDGSCAAPFDPAAVDLNGDGRDDFDYQISVLGSSSTFDGLPPLERDSTIEVSLLNYPRDTAVSVYWVDRSSSGQLAANSGMELSIIYCDDDGATCTTKNYLMQRTAYDTVASRANGIPKLALGSFDVNGVTYGYRAVVTPPGGKYPAALRLRVMYATEAVSVAVQSAGGAVLPVQGQKVESSGFSGQVIRKVEVVRTNPFLSELFDFAIFSGSESDPLSR
ncbi:MAG: hypothetical protein Q8P12_05035 [bacterium]|nr:hypothetical protein [bacterium]